MNKPDLWMPLYVGDYLADTGRLTTEQHGAYLLLLLDYWRSGALPDDDAILAGITKSAPAVWQRLRAVLAPFFQLRDGRWYHKRVEAELEAARDRQQKAHERAVKGGRAAAQRRAASASSDAPSTASGSASSDAPSTQQAMLEQCQSPSSSPSPSASKPAEKRVRRANGSAHPEVDTRPTWEAYSAGFVEVYKGTQPTRNAKVNSQMRDFVKRIGVEEAPAVAAFYVRLQEPFYVKSCHPVDVLLRQAETLRTKWATAQREASTAESDRASRFKCVVCGDYSAVSRDGRFLCDRHLSAPRLAA